MKKKLAVVVLFLVATLAAGQTVLRVAVAEGYSTYESVVSAVYQEIGLVPQFSVVPAARGSAGFETGEYDADLGRTAVAIAALTNAAPTTESILDIHVLAMYRDGFSGGPLTPRDLSKFRLVSIRGIKLTDSILAQGGLKAETMNDLASMEKFLSAGRADVGLFVWAGQPPKIDEVVPGLVVQDEPLFSAKTFHLFTKKYADLVPQWDATLKAMKADGRLQKLLIEASNRRPQ
jgi:hypothetical protein